MDTNKAFAEGGLLNLRNPVIHTDQRKFELTCAIRGALRDIEYYEEFGCVWFDSYETEDGETREYGYFKFCPERCTAEEFKAGVADGSIVPHPDETEEMFIYNPTEEQKLLRENIVETITEILTKQGFAVEPGSVVLKRDTEFVEQDSRCVPEIADVITFPYVLTDHMKPLKSEKIPREKLDKDLREYLNHADYCDWGEGAIETHIIDDPSPEFWSMDLIPLEEEDKEIEIDDKSKFLRTNMIPIVQGLLEKHGFEVFYDGPFTQVDDGINRLLFTVQNRGEFQKNKDALEKEKE